MIKVVLLFLIHILFIYNTSAQTAVIDKNKVLDFFQNQQYDEAITYLTTDANNDSTNVQRLSFLGYAHFMNDNYKIAQKYYLQMFSIDSNNLTALQYLQSINNNPHPEKAEMFTLRLIKLQPLKASNYRILADLFRRKNQKDSALLYFDQAYSLAPNDYKNATGLAEILIDKKLYQRADSILEAGLLKDSLSIPYLRLSIKSAYEAKDYQRVLVPGERFIRLNEILLNPLTQLVLSYYNLKMYKDCIRVCEYMLANELTIESVYYYEARSLAKLKEYDKSNELLQICLSKAVSETAEMYYYNLGQNYEALRQYKKAVAQYDTAYYLFKDPLMNYNAGSIYESNLKNTKLANRYFTKYLELAKPSSADEKKAYEYVKSRWGKHKAAGNSFKK